MQKKVLAALVASVMAGQAMAITVVDDGTNTFAIGGHVGARYNTDDGTVNGSTMKGDSSRINFGFEHKLNEVTTAFAKVEWGFDITNDNREGDDSDGLLTNRLGYVGVMNEQLGTVVFGKAWSSYGKVAGWTDMFATAPAGGAASGYYGDDGDALGTARADDVLQYSYSRMGLNLSLQTQLGERDSSWEIGPQGARLEQSFKRDSSYGISASYDLPMGLSFGAGYNQADLSEVKVDGVDESNHKANSTVVGVKFEAEKIYAAFTYSDLENRYVNDVFFAEATGMELYASYQLNETIKVEGGYVQLDGEDVNGMDMDTEIKAMPVGVVYTQGPIQLSATYQYEKSKELVDGKKVEKDDTAVLQARYYF